MYIYMYIYIYFIHISHINTSRDHGCLGALLSFQLQLSAWDSHCQKGCRCWRFFVGNHPFLKMIVDHFIVFTYIYISGPALLVSVACFLPGMFSAGGLNHRPSKLLSAVKQTKNRHTYNYSIYIYYNYVYIYNTYIFVYNTYIYMYYIYM